MKYLEFIYCEETQMVELIQIRDDALLTFYYQTVTANYGGRVALISSLYSEVFTTIKNLKVSKKLKIAEFNGRIYEMQTHMFTSYLVRIFYNTQYWDNLVDAIEFCSKIEPNCVFKITLSNLHEKLTKEPIENFVKEVQIVNPEYCLIS